GRDAGGSGRRLVTLEDADARSIASSTPGTGEPDHAGADDDRVEPALRCVVHSAALPGGRCAPTSLRRHYPDQVQTVGGASSRPLSPWWAPVAQPSYCCGGLI